MTRPHGGGGPGGARRLRAPGAVPPWWQPPRADRFGRRAPRAEGPGGDAARGARHARTTGRPARRTGLRRRLVLGGLAAVLLAPLSAVALVPPGVPVPGGAAVQRLVDAGPPPDCPAGPCR